MTIKDLKQELVFQITNIRRCNALGLAEQLLMTGMIQFQTHQAIVAEINTKALMAENFLQNKLKEK